MVAIPVAAVFLVVLARQLRQRNWRILGQLGGFAVICFPLGLWYPVRNLVRFGVPLTYVQEMPENSVQYLGGTVVSFADPGLFAASGGKRFRTVGTANRRQLQRV